MDRGITVTSFFVFHGNIIAGKKEFEKRKFLIYTIDKTNESEVIVWS